MTDLMTCDKCPKVETCQTLCSDMEKVLASRAATISHHSVRVENGIADMVSASSIVASMTQAEHHQDPEQILLRREREAHLDKTLTEYIRSFMTETGVREENLGCLESALKLHFIDGYTPTRCAEILGESDSRFRGRAEHRRVPPRPEGDNVKTSQRGATTVTRWCKEFSAWAQAKHLQDAIRRVLQTGSIDHVRTL